MTHDISLIAWQAFSFLWHIYTLFEIFIFCPKIQLWFPEKVVDFFSAKNSWKCCGFGLFSCWQLWFHEKNCQKKIGWKTRENVGVLSKLNFWTKIWLFKRCDSRWFVLLSWRMLLFDDFFKKSIFQEKIIRQIDAVKTCIVIECCVLTIFSNKVWNFLNYKREQG